MASVALLALIVGWIALDPSFKATANDLLHTSGWVQEVEKPPADSSRPASGKWLLPAAVGLGAALQLAMFAGLLIGSQRQRSLASWMIFFAIGGLWLTTALHWRDIAWWGKQQRLLAQLAGFDAVANELRSAWPAKDGALASRDPFMAYPVGEPSVLIMLTLPVLPNTSTTFGVVERGGDGALRFELAGPESGDWLEWHPGGGRPHSFIGGLLESRELERAIPLRGGWHLAHYRPPTSPMRNW